MAKKRKTLSKLTKECVALYNKMGRIRAADKFGYCICVTCGARKHYKECHYGHFRHGLHFVDDNQHIQCVKCNFHLSGNMAKYTLWMIDRYGRLRVDELIYESNQIHKYSQRELEEKRLDFKNQLKDLE